MSLDYSTKKIADDPTLTNEDGYWIPEFQSVCFATMFTGISELKDSNIEEFYRRYTVWNLAYGNEPYATFEVVAKFVGLATNASSKTISAFNKDVLGILERRANEFIASQVKEDK